MLKKSIITTSLSFVFLLSSCSNALNDGSMTEVNTTESTVNSQTENNTIKNENQVSSIPQNLDTSTNVNSGKKEDKYYYTNGVFDDKKYVQQNREVDVGMQTIAKSYTDNNPKAEFPIKNIVKVLDSGYYAVLFGGLEDKVFYTTRSGDFFITKNANNQSIFYDKNLKPLDPNSQDVTTKELFGKIYIKLISALNINEVIQFTNAKAGDTNVKDIFIFTDPDCPFCKKQDNDWISKLKQDNELKVKIYYIMSPLTSLHPDAKGKARVLACSPEKDKDWENWQLNNSQPTEDKMKNTCKTIYDQLTLSEILGISATPTTIFGNGFRIDGTLPYEEMKKMLLHK